LCEFVKEAERESKREDAKGRGRGRGKEINGERERVVEKGERVVIGVHVCVYGIECV